MKIHNKKIFLHLIFLMLIILTPSLLYGNEEIQIPKLGTVYRNNEVIKIYDGNIIFGNTDDVITVSGQTEKGYTVKAIINNREYTATPNVYNDWFIPFSITNFTRDIYTIDIYAQKDDFKSNTVTLLTLHIGNEPEDGVLGSKDENVIEQDTNILKTIIIFILIILVTILIIFFVIKGKRRKNIL